jgi:hypothetical protein
LWPAITGTAGEPGGVGVPSALATDERLELLHSLVRRADGGDEEALVMVRQVFDSVPELWNAYGDLAERARQALVDLIAGDSLMTRESLGRTTADMTAELCGPDASALERLLVDRVVLCWLQAHEADLAYARALKRGESSKTLDDCHRRQDRSARLYIKSLQALAVVRRLVPPNVQVNLAQQQINIAGQEVQLGTRG